MCFVLYCGVQSDSRAFDLAGNRKASELEPGLWVEDYDSEEKRRWKKLLEFVRKRERHYD